MKVNVFTGTIGALIGVLIGVAVWVGIYHFGYIASLAGAVMMICAFKGFELLGRGMNMAGLIICIVIVLAAVFGAHTLSIILEVMWAEESGDISFWEACQRVKAMSALSGGFEEGYIKDLIMGYAFTLLAIVPIIKNYVKGREN